MDKQSSSSQNESPTKEVVEEIVAKPKHSSWYKSWKLLNKDQRGALITALFLAVFLPITALAVRSEQLTRGRADEPVTPPCQDCFPDVDPQTSEFYNLKVATSVSTKQPGGAGPTYVAETVIQFSGSAVEPYRRLYAYKQQPEEPYAVDSFVLDQVSPGIFTATVNLLSNNCLDLYNRSVRKPSNYIATTCYRNSHPTSGATGKHYAPAANLFFDYSYEGGLPTTLQYFSTAFNKYDVKPDGSEDGPYMTRVNFLTIDHNQSQEWQFSDVVYSISGITSGLSDQQYYDLCQNPEYSRYIRVLGPDGGPKPEGGELYAITSENGACNFGYTRPDGYLVPNYMSLYLEGGVPLPSPSQTPTPSPTPPSGRNSPPTITTTSLPNAQVGVYYQAVVGGTDPDPDQLLSLTANGLPDGLSIGPCAVTAPGSPSSGISCNIVGTPTLAGRNSVSFTISDNLGASRSKNLGITIY